MEDGELFIIKINPPEENKISSSSNIVIPRIETEKRPLPEQPEIYCPLCEQNPNKQTCIACNKSKYLTLKSNFSKFVTAIFNWKLGKSPETNYQNSHKNDAFEFVPRSYQSEVVTYHAQQSTYIDFSNIPFRKPLRSDNGGMCVHRNVKCNGCGILPITGSRYMCKECLGYDLCEKCFDEIDHEHNLTAVHQSRYSKRKTKLRLHATTHKQLEDLGGGVMNFIDNLRNML